MARPRLPSSRPTRTVPPDCSIGGLVVSSASRFVASPKGKDETRTSPWMWTLPSEAPVIRMSPAAFANSSRTGPCTEIVRSKLPSALGPTSQAASPKARATAAIPVMAALCFVIAFQAPCSAFVPPYRKIRNPGGLCSLGRFGAAIALCGQSLVQRALSVAFEIQRNKGESHRFEPGRDFRSHRRRECASHFVGGDLDARQLVMQTNTELPESQIPEGSFSALDKAEAFRCYLRAIRNARRQARGRGAVPCGQPRSLRELANFDLAQAGVQ